MPRKVQFTAIQWARSLPTMLHSVRVDRLAHHLVVLVSTYANNDGSNAWVSVRTLAEQAHADLVDVEAALQRLEDHGYLIPAAGPNGRPGWDLNLAMRHDGDAVMEDRAERRRASARERQRRRREKLKGDLGNGAVQRDVTQEYDATSAGGNTTVERDVTQDSGVTTKSSHAEMACDKDDVTPQCHAVTPQEALQPQVTAPYLPDLPKDLPPSLAEPGESKAETISVKDKRNKFGYTAEFETAWALYPKRPDSNSKGSKSKAFREWKVALKVDKVTTARLTDAVRRLPSFLGTRYPKDMERWLRDHDWEAVEEATAGTSPASALSYEALLASADAKRAADMIRAPYVDPSQHPNDPTPRAAWLRARRLEWLEQHESQIRSALTAKAS